MRKILATFTLIKWLMGYALVAWAQLLIIFTFGPLFDPLCAAFNRRWPRDDWNALIMAVGLTLVVGLPWYIMTESSRAEWQHLEEKLQSRGV